MKHTTLLFLLRDDHILLAMKKRGFGVGRWNGVGGKIETGESIEQAAVRECTEEIGVKPHSLTKVARLSFVFPDDTPDILTHVFATKSWKGEPIETEEMAPQWFRLTDIPYHAMWQDDKLWLPHVLDGKKVIASFGFDNNENMLDDATVLNLVDEIS